MPNGSGEKAKGAILSRAVQYIHHLKENEARNIEKWTLEKLLMDQAMGDLQSQLDEMRRMWEEERAQRARAEAELELLRGLKGDDSMESTGSKRQRIERVPGSRRARLTPAPGTSPEPVPVDEEPDAAPGAGAKGAASGPNDERLRQDVPPHY